MPDQDDKKDEEKKQKNVPPPPGQARRKRKKGAANAVKIPTGKSTLQNPDIHNCGICYRWVGAGKVQINSF